VIDASLKLIDSSSRIIEDCERMALDHPIIAAHRLGRV